MTPNLILLNVLSLALVCLLALFARHNKKVGWVKTRSTFVEDLRALQQDWAEQDQLAASPQMLPAVAPQTITAAMEAPELSRIDQHSFASQLASLHTALKDTVPQGDVSSSVADTRELAAK